MSGTAGVNGADGEAWPPYLCPIWEQLDAAARRALLGPWKASSTPRVKLKLAVRLLHHQGLNLPQIVACASCFPLGMASVPEYATLIAELYRELPDAEARAAREAEADALRQAREASEEAQRQAAYEEETQRRAHAHDTSPQRGTLHGKLLVLNVDDADTALRRDYLLKGLISPAEISLWVGPPKCGKSFLMLYIAYLLALGRPVFGRRVKQATVLYVAAEGEGGIATRIRALRNRYGRADRFYFIAQPADLLHQNGHLGDLIKAADAIGAELIVIDTLNRALAGGDENTSQDMGTFVCNVTNLRQSTGAHIAIVHHGTQASGGTNPRGHGSITGADDALVKVTKLLDGSREAVVVHAKDDADGMRWSFKLEVVEMGTDDDGDPITTLLVNEQDEPAAKPAKEKPLSAGLQFLMKSLHSAMKANAILATVGEEDAEISVVTEADWRNWFYREKPGADEAKQKPFRRGVDDLVAKGFVGSRDGFLWPIKR